MRGKVILSHFSPNGEIVFSSYNHFENEKNNTFNFTAGVKLSYTEEEAKSEKKVYLLIQRLDNNGGNTQYRSAQVKDFTLIGDNNYTLQNEYVRDENHQMKIDGNYKELNHRINVKNFETLGPGEYALVLKEEEHIEDERMINNWDSILDVEYFYLHPMTGESN